MIAYRQYVYLIRAWSLHALSEQARRLMWCLRARYDAYFREPSEYKIAIFHEDRLELT